MYYSLKYKNKFRNWLWIKVREPKIQKYYHPNCLKRNLDMLNENNDEDLFNTLINW